MNNSDRTKNNSHTTKSTSRRVLRMMVTITWALFQWVQLATSVDAHQEKNQAEGKYQDP